MNTVYRDTELDERALGLTCPVTFSPHPHQIEAARRRYDDWRQALSWVREGLVAGGMLREVEVTAAMPRARPWKSRDGR